MQYSFREIEDMYRLHSQNVTKIMLADMEPKITQTITNMPMHHSGDSMVEKLAIAKADPDIEIKKVQRLLGAMTNEERLFIQYRYFEDRPIKLVASMINQSRTNVFRLRKSVLSKSKYMLEGPG